MIKKIDKRVWYALPILVGVYLIYKQFAKNKPLPTSPTPSLNNNNNSNNNNPIYNSTYPLKNGSRDAGSPNNPTGLVVELQKLINTYGGYRPKVGFYVSLPIRLTEDGIYGSNTEWAVEQYIGKKTVDTRADLLKIEQKMIEKQQRNYFLNPNWSLF
jgi:hypothetical protein